MRICIFGAGAIGGFLAAKLAAVGVVELSIVARGAHLEAIRRGGLRLVEAGTERSHALRATGRPEELGAQDYVILALKAHSVTGALDQIVPLLGADTTVVTAQNGVPWWYFYRHGGPFEGTRLAAVDPGGAIWARIDPARVIGCIAYPAAEVEAPGLVRHIEGDRFPLGEP
jgi:2-dehydropantoate 2-reductase